MITGSTGSADFPTTPGAVQPTFHGGTGTFEDVPADAFAAKLDPSGSRLVYSTYLGGSADDVGSSVALDHAGNAYYAGSTASPEFPTTPGALKTSLQPGTTLIGFVTKLDPAGRLKWSTYLGGNGLDSASGIGVDSSRHVYVSWHHDRRLPGHRRRRPGDQGWCPRLVRRKARPLGRLAGLGDLPGRQ